MLLNGSGVHGLNPFDKGTMKEPPTPYHLIYFILICFNSNIWEAIHWAHSWPHNGRGLKLFKFLIEILTIERGAPQFPPPEDLQKTQKKGRLDVGTEFLQLGGRFNRYLPMCISHIHTSFIFYVCYYQSNLYVYT